jgi:hypothetical protein
MGRGKRMTNGENRIDKILRQCISEFNLDLQGLTIFTEGATGPYLYTPILAVMAGAHKVYAVTADSKFGTKEQVKLQTLEATARWGVADKIDIIFEKSAEQIGASDIITNSGFVRPITREMISWMKPTAVIPLMWEPWEFRDEDLDLQACREYRILVLGTNESDPPLSMFPYGGFVAMKLIFELGLEGYKTEVLLLGGGGLGNNIHEHFKRLRMDVSWFSDPRSGEQSTPYELLPDRFLSHGADYDVLIVAEHQNDVCLLGSSGLISFEIIKQINPGLRIGVIAGNLEVEELRCSGLCFSPKDIRPFGYMSYQPFHLGPRPVLELYAAGLKVGEAMARARRSGLSLKEAAMYALKHSPAMDFGGGQRWI